MRRRAFTLVELLFVIGIIGTLASILFPVFARARETARRSSCASNLSQVGQGLTMYAQDYDGRFPPDDNELGPVYAYSSAVDVFYCPSDSAEHYWRMDRVDTSDSDSWRGERMRPVETYSSYVYKGGLTNEDRADTVIAGEARLWHGYAANVLHIGGHVKGIPAEIYKPVVPQTKEPVSRTPDPHSAPPGMPPGMPPPTGGG